MYLNGKPEDEFLGHLPSEDVEGGLMGANLGGNPDDMAGLGGDLLVIEGLGQSEEPRETDYLPELVNWTWKPFTDGYGAYRQGRAYWGVGVQRRPGFEPRCDPRAVRFNREAASRYTEGLGLHTPDEAEHARRKAFAAHRTGMAAIRARDHVAFAHSLGYLMSTLDLALHERADELARDVHGLVNALIVAGRPVGFAR